MKKLRYAVRISNSPKVRGSLRRNTEPFAPNSLFHLSVFRTGSVLADRAAQLHSRCAEPGMETWKHEIRGDTWGPDFLKSGGLGPKRN